VIIGARIEPSFRARNSLLARYHFKNHHYLQDEYPSQPYNPDIANAFFRVRMIEAWGRGIQKVMQACRNAGLELPTLTYEKLGLWVEFSYPPMSQPSGEATQETTQKRILALLRQEPALTCKALAAGTGITADGIKYHLTKLTESGRIRRVGPTRKGHWEVLAKEEEK